MTSPGGLKFLEGSLSPLLTVVSQLLDLKLIGTRLFGSPNLSPKWLLYSG